MHGTGQSPASGEGGAQPPIRQLEARHAAVEYWFFTFRAGALSFLVDFILRRNAEPNVEVRVSRWVGGVGVVAREHGASVSGTRSIIEIPGAQFAQGSSAGAVADCRWDLTWALGPWRVDPLPGLLAAARTSDMDVAAMPGTLFDGWVEIGGQRFEVARRPGVVMHYWGRRLPDRWIWVSAAEFVDAPERRVEALLGWTSTWGRGPRHPVGYLWTTDGSTDDMTASPLNGLIRVERRLSERDGVTSVALASQRLFGARHRLEVSAPVDKFNDIGDGIDQTLLGDLTFDGLRAVPGSVGFEHRGLVP